MEQESSLAIAAEFLGKTVEVVMDRPLGSKHPKHGFVYEANYGYVPGTRSPDGEELEAYFFGVSEPKNEISMRRNALNKLSEFLRTKK